jgi:lipopolysaccharide transport system permease protein
MVFGGMLAWTLCATGLAASNSLINNSNLNSKVYFFPRMIVPIAIVVVSFVDFLISFVILIYLIVWHRFLRRRRCVCRRLW